MEILKDDSIGLYQETLFYIKPYIRCIECYLKFEHLLTLKVRMLCQLHIFWSL